MRLRRRFDPETPLPRGNTDENPKGIGLFELLAEDFRTHGNDPLSAGFWALAVHRFGNWRMGIKPLPLRAPLTVLYRIGYRSAIALWGIDLPYNVKLGRRFRLEHHGCIHVGARRIGDDVVVRHSVTIGLSSRSERSKAPTIGSRVEIGPGACIVGGIHVGDDCFIGANTVVGESLDSGSTVLGVPAREVDLEQLVKPTPPKSEN